MFLIPLYKSRYFNYSYINIMIVESFIKGLKDEPKTLKDETVESTNPYLPKLYVWYIDWAKGTGKTWSLVTLFKHYEESPIIDKKGRRHEMRTILFCPTGNSNLIHYINH